MKNMIKLPVIALGLMLLLAGTTQKAIAQTEDVSLQSFYDELSPYGTWIQDPQYGYVWRPDVDQEEFRPYYSNGRWAMTEYGNTWVSNYDWGWAPFHYGRWVYNSYNQWIWLPDTVWGPAWVSWRSGGGYYGWAPLGPSISIGINIGRGGYRIPDLCWNFIPYNNIYYSSYPRYYSNRNRVYIHNTVIINNTYVRNNRTYYTGPRADDIRRTTNQRVTVYNVSRSSRPGATRIDRNSVSIYSPRPSRSTTNSTPAPRTVVQGSINRGPVGRSSISTTPRTESRTGSGNVPTRAPRSSNGVSTTVPSRVSTAPTNDRVPNVIDRSTESSRASQPERVERTQPAQPQAQPRVEPSRPAPQPQQAQPQRAPVQRQAPPQRMERPQAQPRVERPQPAPQQRSSGSESRSGGGSSRSGGASGRPTRG